MLKQSDLGWTVIAEGPPRKLYGTEAMNVLLLINLEIFPDKILIPDTHIK